MSTVLVAMLQNLRAWVFGTWNLECTVFESLYSTKSQKKKELGIAQPRYWTGRRDSSMVSRKAST